MAEYFENDINGIQYWLSEIRAKKFKYWAEEDAKNGHFERGLAILEYPWADIELNIGSESIADGTGYKNEMFLSYYCCIKGKATPEDKFGYWQELCYLDDFGFDVEVDFGSENWEQQLKEDMANKLEAFAAEYCVSLYSPNWEDKKDENKQYYSLMGIAQAA